MYIHYMYVLVYIRLIIHCWAGKNPIFYHRPLKTVFEIRTKVLIFVLSLKMFQSTDHYNGHQVVRHQFLVAKLADLFLFLTLLEHV